MALIPVEKAEVGMTLAENVSDRRGRLLIPGGREIEGRHLNAFPMWGITHIEVEGSEPEVVEDPLKALAPWAVAQAGEEISPRFLRANLDHPVVRELNAHRVRNRALELQNGRAE